MTPFGDEYDDDNGLPLGHDLDDGDDLPEIACPSCGQMVTEDTQKCPYCGDWITPRLSSSPGWRRWVYLAVILLMLYAVLRWTF